MNKQEALVALLTKAREWEQPNEEVRKDHVGTVLTVLDRNVARLMDLREDEEFGVNPPKDADVTAALICIGAAALYLITDEVTVVQGRTLEEWLAERDASAAGLLTLRPTNGTIGKVRDA